MTFYALIISLLHDLEPFLLECYSLVEYLLKLRNCFWISLLYRLRGFSRLNSLFSNIGTVENEASFELRMTEGLISLKYKYPLCKKEMRLLFKKTNYSAINKVCRKVVCLVCLLIWLKFSKGGVSCLKKAKCAQRNYFNF